MHKRTKYSPKGIGYPSLVITRSNYLHQLDVVGPRYLKEDGQFYSANIIDAYETAGIVLTLMIIDKTG